jgi:hypothetical protein
VGFAGEGKLNTYKKERQAPFRQPDVLFNLDQLSSARPHQLQSGISRRLSAYARKLR